MVIRKKQDRVAFKSQQPRLISSTPTPHPTAHLTFMMFSLQEARHTNTALLPQGKHPLHCQEQNRELTGTSCLSSAHPPPTGAADMSRVRTGGTEKSLSSWAVCRALNHWPVLCTPPGWGHLQPAVTTFYFLSISQLKILRSTEPSRDA